MTTIDNRTLAAINGTAGGTSTSSSSAQATASADRFLKLLVAQMSNQDPLNPMDNAQVTSQMAQINTVSGIEKLNATVQDLGGQFTQLQMLQGVSLVGRDVVVAGDRLSGGVDGAPASGLVELASRAARVRMEVLDGSGRVIDTEAVTPEGGLAAGRHTVAWTPSAGVDVAAGQRIRMTAFASDGTTVVSRPLVRDRVDAVSTAGGSLGLELRRTGAIGWGDILSMH